MSKLSFFGNFGKTFFQLCAALGGAILPKLIGHVADRTDILRSFVVSAFCFVFITSCASAWPRLVRSGDRRNVNAHYTQ